MDTALVNKTSVIGYFRRIEKNIEMFDERTVVGFENAKFVRDNKDTHSVAELSDILNIDRKTIRSVIDNKAWIYDQEEYDKFMGK